jgi:hypothetical protein
MKKNYNTEYIVYLGNDVWWRLYCKKGNKFRLVQSWNITSDGVYVTHTANYAEYHHHSPLEKNPKYWAFGTKFNKLEKKGTFKSLQEFKKWHTINFFEHLL